MTAAELAESNRRIEIAGTAGKMQGRVEGMSACSDMMHRRLMTLREESRKAEGDAVRAFQVLAIIAEFGRLLDEIIADSRATSDRLMQLRDTEREIQGRGPVPPTT